jgi:hypothetical protein
MGLINLNSYQIACEIYVGEASLVVVGVVEVKVQEWYQVDGVGMVAHGLELTLVSEEGRGGRREAEWATSNLRWNVGGGGRTSMRIKTT